MSYLDRRGVTSLEIIKYQIGYCEEGPYKHKVIVPSYDEYGMLNYFVGRSFLSRANNLWQEGFMNALLSGIPTQFKNILMIIFLR